MYKIAVLGDRDSIYGYAALGLDTYPINDRETAIKTLRKLAEDDYAVIYITEALQENIESELDRYRTNLLPAIIPIPGVYGNTGKKLPAR